MNATDVPACWLWPLPGPDLDRALGDLEAMADWQGSRMALDHDHETALVRGWLCRGCNVVEGGGGSERIERYRLINPASICGIEERYVDSWGREAVPRNEDPLWNLPMEAWIGKKGMERLHNDPAWAKFDAIMAEIGDEEA